MALFLHGAGLAKTQRSSSKMEEQGSRSPSLSIEISNALR
jgi:hypothetical protein